MITIKLNFYKLSTSENTTVIISDYVPERLYSKITDKVMASTYLQAEQVGFLLPPEHKISALKLRMSGGEFCGNGLLALSALTDYLGIVDNSNFLVEISGVNLPLTAEVIDKNYEKINYVIKADMPFSHSRKIYKCNFSDKINGEIIFLSGISHFIIKGKKYFKKNILKDIMNEISRDISGKAVGIIPYYIKEGNYQIKPYIHVKENNSFVFERGCGSGTLALGLYLAEENNENIKISVHQPGGIIEVGIKLNDKNKVNGAYLKSEVSLNCQGEVII
ncbi:MAG: hypothetical protein ACOC4G_03820 [Bacillota bacterium]